MIKNIVIVIMGLTIAFLYYGCTVLGGGYKTMLENYHKLDHIHQDYVKNTGEKIDELKECIKQLSDKDSYSLSNDTSQHHVRA